MGKGKVGIKFQSLFRLFDPLFVLSGRKVPSGQIGICVQVERVKLDGAAELRECLLMISQVVQVEAVQNVGAAQIRIQLEGTFKLTRGRRGNPYDNATCESFLKSVD